MQTTTTQQTEITNEPVLFELTMRPWDSYATETTVFSCFDDDKVASRAKHVAGAFNKEMVSFARASLH